MAALPLRVRTLVEFAFLATATVLYFLFVPRSTPVDMTFGAVGLFLVAVSYKETRDRFWEKPHLPYGERLKQSSFLVLVPSAVLFFIFAEWNMDRAYHETYEWGAAWNHFFGNHFFLALPIFIAWAFVQQFLCQFYLLGRLRVLIPSRFFLLVASGLGFSAVHIPDWNVVAVTAFAGMVWSWIYLEYRCILPLAISHGILGTAYFHWVLNKPVFKTLFLFFGL